MTFLPKGMPISVGLFCGDIARHRIEVLRVVVRKLHEVELELQNTKY